MVRILGIILLILIVAIAGVGYSVYAYLSPEEAFPKITSPSSIRTIDSGRIIGFQGKYDAHAWLGIPYAQPPVKDLRWKAPRAPIPWVGEREMLEYGNPCMQLPAVGNDDGRGYVGDEDCLVLNVWAPQIGPTKIPTGSDRLPVMFWIHGGGNSVGSGGSDTTALYDGSLLASEHGVIVITVNHRMGPMGWFVHPALSDQTVDPEDLSGNFGTLDLIEALRWVQANIESFGGDPGNITIFGESAGGSNVLSLMASPMATGLFHKAIVQSGALNLTSLAEAQRVGPNGRGGDNLSSREIAARLMIEGGSALIADKDAAFTLLEEKMTSAEVAAWLRSVPAADIYGVVDSFFGGMIGMPMMFRDGYVLPDMDVNDIFADPANYNSVPIILGSNRDEAKLFFAFDDRYIDVNNGIPQGFKDLEAYNRDTGYGSDVWRSQGVDRVAEMMSLVRPDDVFAYRFDADDWRNIGFIDLKDLLGAAHALELPFVFGYFPKPARLIFPDSTFAEVELLSGSIMSYWTQFAHTGKPGTGWHGEDPSWTPWRSMAGSGHLMLLDTEIDEGIRMDQQVLNIDEIKADWMADGSYQSKEERCQAYDVAFFIEFDADEKASLGCE